MQRFWTHRDECPYFLRKQRKGYNVTNDKIYEESGSDQEINVVTFTTHVKDMQGVTYTSEPLNSKNMCVTSI